MWTNNRFNPNNSSNINQTSNASQLQSNPTTSKMSSSAMSSLDTNQLLMAANSLRTLFGDNLNPNLLQTIRDTASANRPDMGLGQMPAQRAPERRPPGPAPTDYGSQHFSRIDRNLSTNSQQFDDSSQLRTESRFYDPSKMPQKSILKKSKDQPFLSESINFNSVEEEDCFLYGSSGSAPNSGALSGALPPGIVQLEQHRNDISSASNAERPLSPISLRLKREMENMDRSMNPTAPKGTPRWMPTHTDPPARVRPVEEPTNRRNDWLEEEDNYERRYRQHMNPSPDNALEVERVRIQQLAAIEAGILSKEKQLKRSPNLSPLHRLSDLKRPDYGSARRFSPESSPKRLRRRSPSLSPRRRSISPLYIRPQSRSSSRERYRRSRSRSHSRSRSDSRNRSRRRSRSPDRRRISRSPSYRSSSLTDRLLPNPTIPMRAQGYDMSYASHTPLVSGSMGSKAPMGHYLPHIAPTYPIAAQNIPEISRSLMSRTVPRKQSALRNIPLTHSSPQKAIEKKEDKLINPKDLLIAERAKLREELTALKKQYDRKFEEQEIIVTKDGGTDSYAYRQLEKILKDLRLTIETTHNKLTKNFQHINDVQKSKTNEKDFKEKIKASGDISKVELKRKPPVVDLTKNANTGAAKKAPEKPREQPKESVEDIEAEEEKNSRFQYFDQGPHWCRSCDIFVDNMKKYFIHIHTKDHMNRQKESDRTEWITKDYIKQMEDKGIRNKNRMLTAAKGIQFIHPTQGFYCQLCKQFMNDSYAVEKHFKTAKHNRIYTHYTLQHIDYEHRWRAERDKAYTEMKRKERELEKEKSNKELEEKANQRKKLEEEVKRKDREVKEKIEAMNKSLKTVQELEDPKKEDKTKSSPKSIRLNLSSHKTESTVESKKSDKNSEKTENVLQKTDSTESEPNIEDNAENAPKSAETVDTSEGIEDMLVIDEINCESQEERLENKDLEENIDENALLYPENIADLEQTPDLSDANKTENSDKNEEKVMEIVEPLEDVEPKQSQELTENKEISTEDKTENIGNEKTLEEVEGVMPEVVDKCIEDVQQIEAKLVSNETIESKPESTDTVIKIEDNIENEPIIVDSIDSSKPNETDESNAVEEQDLDNSNVDTQDKDLLKVVEKDSSTLKSDEKEDKSNDKQIKCVEVAKDVEQVAKNVEEVSKDSEEVLKDSEKVVKESTESSNENVEQVVKTEPKSEDNFDLDLDIAKLNERFETLVKQEVREPEGEDEDELEGFDVIDESYEEPKDEVIELSD